eukprot:6202008-Pleurochrysis_carterae.AAC.1
MSCPKLRPLRSAEALKAEASGWCKRGCRKDIAEAERASTCGKLACVRLLVEEPPRADLRVRVRPPTGRTHRRRVEVKAIPFLRPCFEAVMAPAKCGEVDRLVRNDAYSGLLVSTNADKPGVTTERFEYTFVQPMLNDRLFQLKQSDL